MSGASTRQASATAFWPAGRRSTVRAPIHRGTRTSAVAVSSASATACANAIVRFMSHPLPLPPPGFDDLPVEDQIDYVQSLWDHIAASVDQVPLHEWQQAILNERLAAHRRAPQESRPWEKVIEGLQHRLRDRPSMARLEVRPDDLLPVDSRA